MGVQNNVKTRTQKKSQRLALDFGNLYFEFVSPALRRSFTSEDGNFVLRISDLHLSTGPDQSATPTVILSAAQHPCHPERSRRIHQKLSLRGVPIHRGDAAISTFCLAGHPDRSVAKWRDLLRIVVPAKAGIHPKRYPYYPIPRSDPLKARHI